MSYGVWLAIIYFHARQFFACGSLVGADISLATGGTLATLSFGRAVTGLRFTHHFIKKKMCLRKCKAVAHNDERQILSTKGDEVAF